MRVLNREKIEIGSRVLDKISNKFGYVTGREEVEGFGFPDNVMMDKYSVRIDGDTVDSFYAGTSSLELVGK